MIRIIETERGGKVWTITATPTQLRRILPILTEGEESTGILGISCDTRIIISGTWPCKEGGQVDRSSWRGKLNII